MRPLAIAMLFALGCGGSAKRAGDDTAGNGAGRQAGHGASDSSGEPAAPVSPEECRRFTAHVVELFLVEMRRSQPPETIPTDEQVAEVRAKLDAELTERCVQFPRAVLECGLAATSVAAVAECEEVAPR